MVLITGFGLALLVIIVMLASGTSPEQAMAEASPVEASESPGAPAVATPAATSAGDIVGDGMIERKGEGRHFYTTIRIPPGAETLYLSGSGARQMEDGTWGDMEQQTIDTFNRFKATLEAEGWSMSDIVQVRAFAVAGEYGLLDFDGFNRGYRQFFGTEENPMKPVRSFVEIAGLVVPGWLVEIEIRAARMPD
jgi:enamine deaminase RidA (YjgF/YER057c/UK114 family)